MPGARAPKTFTREELAARSDALALAIGSRATATVLLIACLIVIMIGAQSQLSVLQGMDRDVKELNEQLAIANGGLEILNTTMDAVPPTAEHLETIVGTVGDVSKQVKLSSANIGSVATTTAEMNTQVEGIAASTTEMRESLASAAAGTGELTTTIGSLNTNIAPLVKTQHDMLLGTRRMQRGLGGMNDSLAYTIRIMNWIAAPPHGQGMTIRADMPKETLPPFVKAEVEPVVVFPRNVWPIYTGP